MSTKTLKRKITDLVPVDKVKVVHMLSKNTSQMEIPCSCKARNFAVTGAKNTENSAKDPELEMWANAQRDGRPAEYRWRPLFNAAKFG